MSNSNCSGTDKIQGSYYKEGHNFRGWAISPLYYCKRAAIWYKCNVQTMPLHTGTEIWTSSC